MTKAKARISANKAAAPARLKRAQMRYLRGDASGVLAQRVVSNRAGSEDVRTSALRASALATDFLHNSGWIAGACDQVITDTIGEGLRINYKPDLSKFEYSDKEAREFAQEVERKFRAYAENPKEVDLAGEKTLAEMDDGVCRYFLSKGEAFGVFSYLGARERQRYGIESGTKVTLVSPRLLKWETNKLIGLQDGIFKDQNGRHTGYRFMREDSEGLYGLSDHDIPAHNRAGLCNVVQLLDRSENPDASRGVPLLTAVLNNLGYQEQLGNATLATALSQAIMAATVKSPDASREVFEAFQVLDDDEELANGLKDLWTARLEQLAGSEINLSSGVRVNHLAPGEEFELHSSKTPNPHYVAFFQNLLREVARRIGVTASNMTMDHKGETYSSVRMAYASIWPIVKRRRNRVVAPLTKTVFANWLDEQIGRGLIAFRGGYEAFRANRTYLSQVEVLGPAAPSADDEKAERARKLRLQNGVTSLRRECSREGLDYDLLLQERIEERDQLVEADLPVPFEPAKGGDGGPNGGAVQGERDAKKS
ncbi:phage portal protein [Polycladidibacter hongkongensis]|uniref:phage portal protein n=1 Tax=Polycladidibacter hongkongensis TaxID=1647556 RepID=UPI00082CA54A|nr:phage portal protein [Pseudovibrio hongkongensis]